MSYIFAPATASALGTVLSLTTDDANVVTPTLAGNINLVGSHGINTSGSVANTASVQIDNAILLGDLVALAAGNDALTITSGDITLSGTGANVGGNINMPNTGGTTEGDIGVINFGAVRYFHIGNSGITLPSIFIGKNAGNFTGVAQNVTAVGADCFSAVTTGTGTGVGSGCLEAVTDATANTGMGFQALNAVTTGSGNCAFGSQAMLLTNGGGNIAVGHLSLGSATAGDGNIALGGTVPPVGGSFGALRQLLTGNYNIALGSGNSAGDDGAGYNYTGAESSNICIGNPGTNGESNVMRLGKTGSGNNQVNKAFIAGTHGITPAGATETVIIDANGQLGSTSSSSGITWSVETGATKAMAVNEAYFANRNGADLAFTLPATAAVGETMEIALMHATGTWSLAQNAGQTCYIGTTNTTTGAGGSLASTAKGDWIEIICRVADTDFQVNVKSGIEITVV